MAKISISYPESGLTPSISVINTTTEVVDFSGTMTEVGTSKVYIYDFTEGANTDYVYTISTVGYDTISDSLFRNTGLTLAEIEASTILAKEASVKLSIALSA